MDQRLNKHDREKYFTEPFNEEDPLKPSPYFLKMVLMISGSESNLQQ